MSELLDRVQAVVDARGGSALGQVLPGAAGGGRGEGPSRPHHARTGATHRRVPRRRSRRAGVPLARGREGQEPERTALGVCSHCKRVPADRGMSRCRACLDYQGAQSVALANRRRAAGLCPQCRGPSACGGWRCERCLVERRVVGPPAPRPTLGLSAEDQALVRRVLLELRDRFGSWRALATAMGVSFDALSRVNKVGRPITRTQARWVADFLRSLDRRA